MTRRDGSTALHVAALAGRTGKHKSQAVRKCFQLLATAHPSLLQVGRLFVLVVHLDIFSDRSHPSSCSAQVKCRRGRTPEDILPDFDHPDFLTSDNVVDL